MIQAGRSWRKGVRTHISLNIANPSGPLFQVPFMFIIIALLWSMYRIVAFVAQQVFVLVNHIDSQLLSV